MDAMKIVPMTALGAAGPAAVARVFVDGYRKDLAAMRADDDAWEQALASSFVPELMWCAVINNEVVGIAALSDATSRAMYPVFADLRAHLGLGRAAMLWAVMRPLFVERLPLPTGAGYVESVATLSSHRGQGIASALLTHLETLGPTVMTLDVTDVNPARSLYAKLGYRETSRKKAAVPRLVGFNEHIYMRKNLL
ncbi:MAG: GNAT family N-acetyltransferase [Cellulomonadaceae bacterium]|jgi:ribosomal protein S18 acetylase RimI-like enzyme|nr:GNAT family N-acetyltransferase [Cellulomonadaceae bacterium]